MDTFDELAAAFQPWDGKRIVPKPADYVPGLYRFHQVEAFDLLKRNRGLTMWAANLLQVIAYRSGDLTPAQKYWLSRLEREADEQEAQHG